MMRVRAVLCLLAVAVAVVECRWSERDDPLRKEARDLVAAVGNFLSGRGVASAVHQLHHFLQADAQNLDLGQEDGRAGAAAMYVLGVKNGGWRRHVAFEGGALQVLTDTVSDVGDAGPAAAAARSIAMLAVASSRVREAAASAGTVRLLIKMASAQPKNRDWSDVQAAAAEAIWSLVYSSKQNHAEAVRRGAVPAMANLARTTGNEWTRMWSMACLHHLAEDYCSSSTGACPWVQVSFAARGLEPDRRGQSDHNAQITVDSSAVRLAMHSQGLLPLAVSMAARGPAKHCPDKLAMGGQERLQLQDEGSLVAWAAAALLKSLAFSHVLHAEILKAGAVPVLAVLRNSTCAIEAESAEMAWKRLMAVSSTRDAIGKLTDGSRSPKTEL